MINTPAQLDMTKHYLLIPQVMARLGVSRNAVYKFMAEHKLKYTFEGQGERTIFKFTIQDVESFKALLKKEREKGKSIVE